MPVENYIDLLPVILLGIVFFGSAVAMIFWSARRGQLRDFDDQAKVIFTHEEPEGEISDHFPDK
ncbi:MAG TPA: hypothetical protein DD622_03120 [Opitutae bacterium]|nr:hypothetical protein [Coraliomargarita sp.]HBO57411.1 hypothetical protein [Opitutae bacterium]|tara:strand:+ start:22749 stop:22940 length:192 start_codon:yes stop_codon:yes gene_type:complete